MKASRSKFGPILVPKWDACVNWGPKTVHFWASCQSVVFDGSKFGPIFEPCLISWVHFWTHLVLEHIRMEGRDVSH